MTASAATLQATAAALVVRTSAKAREREYGAERERLADADGAAGHGPRGGALDVLVELAIGDVVGGSSRRCA